MKRLSSKHVRKGIGGQTLIIALIVLTVLLLIGFVFLGIINRNIVQASRSQQRSVASDLAQAGVRFAHNQLVSSLVGADWRPSPTPPVSKAPLNDFTVDPDALYLRPSSGRVLPTGINDRGGPDGLGSFARMTFRGGRALIRVRYAPSDVDVTQSSPVGPLRNPGQVHNYLIIESIGRPGEIRTNDPTSVIAGTPIKFRNFVSDPELQLALSSLSEKDGQIPDSRKLLAFGDIGIIDHAMFITNIDRVSRPADLGIPYELGVTASDNTGASQDVHVPLQLGDPPAASPTAGKYPGGGSIYSNASLILHGTAQINLNKALGEYVGVAGDVIGGNSVKTALYAQLQVFGYDGNTSLGNQTLTSDPANDSLDSSSANFSTDGGFVRDGRQQTDANGIPRSVAYKTPPSILTADPNSGYNRYVEMSRDSGVILAGGYSGQYGHGPSVYVNNSGDLQTQVDESGRITAGSVAALFNDWLNPNNGQTNSGWQGPYYVPPGAFVQLTSDGFTITLDGRGGMKTWRFPDGSDTGSSTVRYRIQPGNGPRHIINTWTPGVNINDVSPAWNNGPIFDGVLVFEGNVRVRGVIPTDIQLTLVSMGTIYIEGSITKGVETAAGTTDGNVHTSMLALMAKDYVAVNTSQFFGPEVGYQLLEKNTVQNPTSLNPVVMQQGQNDQLNLWAEFLLDPESNPGPAQNWLSYAEEYKDSANRPVPTRFLLTHTMDDGPAPSTYLSLLVNNGYGANPNAANYYFTQPDNSQGVVYTMGQDPWQRYSKFETRSFSFLNFPPDAGAAGQRTYMTSASGLNAYQVKLQKTSEFKFYPNHAMNASNDYLLARSAIVPHDIRIEAVIYAQQGSFFVIPGPWFNPDPSDLRSGYYGALGSNPSQAQVDAARLARLENTGRYPEAPFYAEPLDVRVTVVGSINQNMPAPISQQIEWYKKWGWIPAEHGASGEPIPVQHIPSTWTPAYTSLYNANYSPNLIIKYDQALASGRINGFNPSGSAIRVNPDDPSAMLPPLPRLPVSPSLFYFGEVNP